MSLEVIAASPRVTVRNRAPVRADGAGVLYWMQRAQRGRDNAALDTAIAAANELEKPLLVLVTLKPDFPTTHRHVQFFLEGLPDIADELRERRAGFIVRGPNQSVVELAAETRACLVVGDENFLRRAEEERRRIARRLRVPFWTVDADVIVPTALVGREHWAARTIRPHIHAHLAEFLVRAPEPRVQTPWAGHSRRRLRSLDPRAPRLEDVSLERSVAPSGVFRGGPRQARLRLREFVRERLEGYATRRNRPDLDGTSQLSPYLRFGHIGPREVALAVSEAAASQDDRAAFLEELIVRRELAVNFVRYNDAYDRLDGCERWARRTLAQHVADGRRLVAPRLLADAESPDPLWNAAQAQLLETGWMHGYMRMYWAKRLLEWTRTPEEAFALALTLNDTFELDGSDPNGYAGIAWAIGGKHDRAFAERPIFGKVRYMSPARSARRFDARVYVARFAPPKLRALGLEREAP